MSENGPVVRVTVPASTANLGPGFDTLGMALPVYLEVELAIAADDINGRPSNTGLIGRIISDTAAEFGINAKFQCRVQSFIPVARGLGSSAAATLAALLAVNELAQLGMDEQTILNRAAAIEGHADNVVPALVGGVTTALVTEDRVWYQRLAPPEFLHLLTAVPEQELKTANARVILPATLTLEDAVFNLQRTSYLLAAFANRDHQGLKEAFQDRWHQPYRQALIPGFQEIKAGLAARPEVLGITISGSGPSLIVWVYEEPSQVHKIMKQILTASGWQGTINHWLPCNQGAKIERRSNVAWG